MYLETIRKMLMIQFSRLLLIFLIISQPSIPALLKEIITCFETLLKHIRFVIGMQ